MFFRNKKSEELYKQLETRLSALEESVSAKNSRLDAIAQEIGRLDTISQEISRLDTISQEISRLQPAIKTLSMSVEDMMDTWEEKETESASIRGHFQECEQTEQALTALYETYQEQFWNLQRFAGGKENALSGQIALMEKTLEQKRRLCGISVIQETGVNVDYDLHEIVEVRPVQDPALDKTIAEIFNCGYIYKGTVKKKALAAAYRLEKKQTS